MDLTRYELWMADVDWHIQRKLILSLHDLPDWRWFDTFENGTSPEDAAASFMEELAEDDELYA